MTMDQFETPELSGSLNASTNSDRRRKDKKRSKKQDARTNRRARSLQKRCDCLAKAARADKAEPPPRRPVVDFDGLSRPGSGTRSRLDEGPEQAEQRLDKMRAAVRTLLECVGEDPDREGLLATPSRYAKALLFLTKGYQVNVKSLVNNALFYEGHNEMVIVKDIDIHSLCEHHLVPFTGKVTRTLTSLRTPSSTAPLDAHRLCPL